MALYAVIDTNVLVSALLSKHSDAATVLLVDRIIRGELIPLFSADTISEYREVLSRKKFKFEGTLIETLLSFISNFGLMLEPSKMRRYLQKHRLWINPYHVSHHRLQTEPCQNRVCG